MADTEQLESLIQEAVKEQTKRMAQTLVGFLVAITTGGAAFLGTGGLEPVARPDPFTGEDGHRLKTEIREGCRETIASTEERVMNKVEHMFEVHRLQIPPMGTRARLYNLEEWAEEQDPSYRRPTTEW